MSILERIAADRRSEVATLKREGYKPPIPAKRKTRRGFRAALEDGGLAIIAEFKRRAPSAGDLGLDLDPAERARQYVAGGAAAISVLTEPRFFAGSYDDLSAAASAVPVPVLCKDFVVDEAQIVWAAQAGAAAILLIAYLLDDADLRSLLATAGEVGVDALVEIHTAEALERALEAGARLVGINNRDLRTFSVDFNNTLELVRLVPPGVTTVAESGVRGVGDLLRLAALPVDAVLVGTTLMRAASPHKLLQEWRAALHAHSG